MKKIILIISIVLCSSIQSIGQYLTLDQLINLRTYSLSKFEDYLTNKNWYFNGSTEEDESSLAVATFDYGRSRYENNKATLFINYIYSNKYNVKRISYQLHLPVEYSKLINRAKALGFKFSESNTRDDRIEKIYKKNNLVIVFSTISETQDYNLSTFYNVKIYEIIDYVSTK